MVQKKNTSKSIIDVKSLNDKKVVAPLTGLPSFLVTSLILSYLGYRSSTPADLL